MNKELLDYIKILSKQDTKSLTAKALKTAEEVGELASKVLPYDGAFATNHRFVERESILEEVADVMLTALSVAYDIGFADDEIEDMMVKKSAKWSKLQTAEIGLKYPIPYEIHVTVNMEQSQPFSGFEDDDETKTRAELMIDKFNQACEAVKVKPILLDLQRQDGAVIKDVMTSSKHFGTNRTAYEEAQRIASNLKARGFVVARTKIETVPWHPAAPQRVGEKMPKDCYFESHIGVVIKADKLREHDAAWLRRMLNNEDVHVSSNVFKKRVDGNSIVMLTYRSKTLCFESFMIVLNSIIEDLDRLCVEYEKPIVEFSVYDTKIAHDAEWLLKRDIEK